MKSLNARDIRNQAIHSLRGINLMIVNRDLSSLLSAIALRSLIGRFHAVNVLWMQDGIYASAQCETFLGFSERHIAIVGVGPRDNGTGAMTGLVQSIRSKNHRLVAICDTHDRIEWENAVGKFSQLAISPCKQDTYYTCPARILLRDFQTIMTPHELLLCNLAHDASSAGGNQLCGISKIIQDVVGDDPNYDSRRMHIVDHFAFHDAPSGEIVKWLFPKK